MESRIDEGTTMREEFGCGCIVDFTTPSEGRAIKICNEDAKFISVDELGWYEVKGGYVRRLL